MGPSHSTLTFTRSIARQSSTSLRQPSVRSRTQETASAGKTIPNAPANPISPRRRHVAASRGRLHTYDRRGRSRGSDSWDDRVALAYRWHYRWSLRDLLLWLPNLGKPHGQSTLPSPA